MPRKFFAITISTQHTRHAACFRPSQGMLPPGRPPSKQRQCNNYSVNITRVCLFYHTLETDGNDPISAATRIPITRSACSQ